MMRDYKIQQKKWPLRKNRGSAMKTVLKIFGFCVVAGAGFVGYQWFAALPKANEPKIDANSRIVPLKIPPNRFDAVKPPAEIANEAR